MEAMDSAFFEAAAESLNHSKINYMNMAGKQPVTVEERHVVTRLPANYMHMNHVGIVYAGSYFVFAEASGATLIKCTYAGRYTPIIKSCSIDYVRPAARDLVIDLSMDEDTAREKIAYIEEKGRGRYPLDIPVKDAGGELCATVHIVYYLIRNHENG